MAASIIVTIATISSAQEIGVSMAAFDDSFLTVLRNGMTDYADGKEGVSLQIEDAQNDVQKQMSQVQNFIALGVDAIIVNAVDTDGTNALTRMAEDAGVPLIYVNRQPVNVDDLPSNQAFVASDEIESGTLQTREVCRLLGGEGRVAIIVGELSNQAARQRTQDVHDVVATDECKGLEIVAEQSANWTRIEAFDLMTNWLSTGLEVDAIIANGDESAIGAIQAIRASGQDPQPLVIAGINATKEALVSMSEGDLDVTVFQDAFGQGNTAIDVALNIVNGMSFDQKTYVPFELVTPENMAEYETRN
ncbi:sugar ABC transporter substrate-binding protein [Amaricoccus sp. W119]|uniref:sugar ABC transporter substrate-binding protein n=1 Tax=Amaricoccus sp. W119 TaxID=3391833 RepID=UPI0039A65748